MRRRMRASRSSGPEFFGINEAVKKAESRALYDDTHNVAEGAAASGLAAILADRERLPGRPAGFVLTGANVDADIFRRVLTGQESNK